jgi:hypothetical protein
MFEQLQFSHEPSVDARTWMKVWLAYKYSRRAAIYYEGVYFRRIERYKEVIRTTGRLYLKRKIYKSAVVLFTRLKEIRL